MKIFDSHIHIFTPKVISNVQKKNHMVQQLHLQTQGAEERVNLATLEKDMKAGGVTGALMLPTASVSGVRKTNQSCIQTAAGAERLVTAGTLHADYAENYQELDFLRQHHVRVIKMCSFSQGFILNGPNALKMFETIEAANEGSDTPFAVILDTLRTADIHFGTRPEFTTTPELLSDIVDRFPGINFIGAHMGGLDAPFDEIHQHLTSRPNFYLDTSNAAHTLSTKEFCYLLEEHGPHHILFGTDWPWFTHENEVERINRLLNLAGFSDEEKSNVFYGNIAALLGMES